MDPRRCRGLTVLDGFIEFEVVAEEVEVFDEISAGEDFSSGPSTLIV